MKVLQINSFFSEGGPPRIVKGIYDTIIENGDECVLAAARANPLPGMDIYKIGNKLTTYYCALSSRLFDNDGFVAVSSTKRLIKRIRNYDPDIIHLHNLHSYYMQVEGLFSYLKECGKPVVWTLHDCWPMTGHCPHFTMTKCNRYKTGCYQCPQKTSFPASYGLDQSRRNWNRKKAAFSGVPRMTLVPVSQWLDSVVKESFLKEYPTRVIYNGLDLKPFRHVKSNFRERYGLEEKKLILGVALHWTEKKGLYDYFKLAGMLDDSYRIILVGDIGDGIQELSGNIIPIEPIYDDNKLAEVYSTSDLCLNLSYEETFGLTSVESLACGTPIITYDLTAVPEIARMFEAPVVHAGNIGELKKTIENYFQGNTPDKHYDVSCFDEKVLYQQYYDLYKELLEKV